MPKIKGTPENYYRLMQPFSKLEINRRLQQRATFAAQRRNDQNRHRCFISYHVEDISEVETFLDTFGSEFIGTCLGVTENDDFVNSKEPEYIKRRIRELHLTNTTVTILLLGKCTWSRQFVDWEISSTLRDDPNNLRGGLLAIPLPSLGNSAILPVRFRDNFDSANPTNSYARFLPYPKSLSDIRQWIDIAFQSRFDSSKSVNNSRELFSSNRDCKQ